jgi:DNA-directed RNA polymerase specialized sigma24 family protein
MAVSIVVHDYATVRSKLLAFAVTLFAQKDRSWREDLVDEVIHRHLAGLAKYDFGCPESSAQTRELGLLRLSLKRAGIDRLRREKLARRLEIGRLLCRQAATFTEVVDAKDTWEAYLRTPGVTTRERRFLRLLIEDGLTSEEIAEACELNAAAVRKALSRAYAKIRRAHFETASDGRGTGS